MHVVGLALRKFGHARVIRVVHEIPDSIGQLVSSGACVGAHIARVVWLTLWRCIGAAIPGTGARVAFEGVPEIKKMAHLMHEGVAQVSVFQRAVGHGNWAYSDHRLSVAFRVFGGPVRPADVLRGRAHKYVDIRRILVASTVRVMAVETFIFAVIGVFLALNVHRARELETEPGVDPVL